MERHVSTFRATGTDGDQYTVEVWEDSVDPSEPDDTTDKAEGFARLRTPDGMTVTKVGPRQYRIFGTDVVLTSDDPAAP